MNNLFLASPKGVLRARTTLSKEQIPEGYEEVVNPNYTGPTILAKIILPCEYREIEKKVSPSCNCEVEYWTCNEDGAELIERAICMFCQRKLWKKEFPEAKDHNKIQKHV